MDHILRSKLEDFFAPYQEKTLPKGKMLIIAGEDPRCITFLLDGIVEQYDITRAGNKITVNLFKPPAFFPMSWAINKTPNEYFFATLTEIRYKQVDSEKMTHFLKANTDLLFDLLSRVYMGTDVLLKRLAVAADGNATNRLSLELLLECYRFGTSAGENKKLITLKQNALAARSGLARETVSRELHKLADQQIVALTKQGIVVDTSLLEKSFAA